MNTTVTPLHTETSISNLYWNMLKNLSVEVKLELIAKLSSSLLAKDNQTNATNGWVSEFAGRWQDDRSADEIMTDIRSARTSNKEIEL